MTERAEKDLSNGYNAIVDDYISARSTTGRDLVKDWAVDLPAASRVLDLGAGFGEPITAALIEAGHRVSAIEAAPSMVAEFRRRFPDTRIACEAAEESEFFGEKFDAICAVGLLFLLPRPAQCRLIQRAADTLETGGLFLFSAPTECGSWDDLLTGRKSVSLGQRAYRELLTDNGFGDIRDLVDSGASHYYAARKLSSPAL